MQLSSSATARYMPLPSRGCSSSSAGGVGSPSSHFGERRAHEAGDLLARQQAAETVRRDAVQREIADADAFGQFVPALHGGGDTAADEAV